MTQETAPTPRSYSIWARLAPIGIAQIYLTLTVLLFAFGPWPWPMTDSTILYAYIFSGQLALLLGYLSAVNKKPKGYVGPIRVKHLAVIAAVLGAAIIYPTYQSQVAEGVTLETAIETPGMAFQAKQMEVMERLGTAGEISTITVVRFLIAPLLVLLLPLVVVWWKELSWPLRVLGVIAISGGGFIGFATGRNKPLGELIIHLFVIFGVMFASRRWQLNFKQLVLTSAIILTLGAGLLTFLTKGLLTGRFAGDPEQSSQYFFGADIYSDETHPLITSAPEVLRPTVRQLPMYLCAGYYGLYLSLQEPFISTYGLGNSFSVGVMMDIFLGSDYISRNTYPARVELNNPNYWRFSNWHTIYPWIASDVSFLGALIVMLLIGRLFALVWLDCLAGKNPFAFGLLTQLAILIVYIPGNNQAVAFIEGFAAFWVLLVLWWWTRKAPA